MMSAGGKLEFPWTQYSTRGGHVTQTADVSPCLADSGPPLRSSRVPNYFCQTHSLEGLTLDFTG